MSVADAVQAAEIVVTYREGRGVTNWRKRNEESPVPGVWPYGLDQIGVTGRRVASREVPDLAGVRRKLATVLGVRRRAAGGGAPGVALAWDEMTAVPMLAGLAAQKYFSGVIWATDAVAAGEDSPQLRLAAKALREMDGLWVLSRPQVDKVREWLGPNCPPVHFLRFGVDPDFYTPRPYPERPHVVSAGGDRDRDVETLFAALQIVRERRPDVECTVQSTSTIQPPAGVRKIAHIPHLGMSELIGSASVVAIATRPNLHASGMTVGLEALSVGRPVVACATPGMDDYFTDGVNSSLVPPKSPERMAAAILAYVDDPAAAAQLGAAGRNAVLARHTTTTMCADLAAIVTAG
jgi:glycosyltransferase involved in cell wall biosynthesis